MKAGVPFTHSLCCVFGRYLCKAGGLSLICLSPGVALLTRAGLPVVWGQHWAAAEAGMVPLSVPTPFKAWSYLCPLSPCLSCPRGHGGEGPWHGHSSPETAGLQSCSPGRCGRCPTQNIPTWADAGSQVTAGPAVQSGRSEPSQRGTVQGHLSLSAQGTSGCV